MRDTDSQRQLDQLAKEHRDAFTDALAEMLDSGFGDLEERIDRPAVTKRDAVRISAQEALDEVDNYLGAYSDR
jgi:hypothetical protein